MPEPYFADPDLTLYQGDALEVLREMPDASVHMACTSPPFFGLRDYGTGAWEGGDEGCDHLRQSSVSRESSTLVGSATTQGGTYAWGDTCGKCGARRIDSQIGLESSPDEWAARLVDVFREVRRVLRDDGVLFIEIGDSFDGKKELIDQPGILKNALRADGWKHRQTIIQHKPNAMPESVTDRCTTSHSYILVMVQGRSYYWDAEALREPWEMRPQNRFATEEWKNGGGPHRRPAGANPGLPPLQVETLDGSDGEAPRGPDGRRETRVEAGSGSIQHRDGERWPGSGKNARTVWTIPTEPNALAICRVCDAYWQGGAPREHCGEPVVQHFAAFPRELVRRMILAGTSERGVCAECGAAWVREVERESAPREVMTRRNAPDDGLVASGRARVDGELLGQGAKLQRWRDAHPSLTLGWLPSCECAADVIPATVLDCFSGSGTALLVARQLGRHGIGIELNERYAAMTRARLAQLSLLAEGAA